MILVSKRSEAVQLVSDGVFKLVFHSLGEASVALCLALKPEKKPISFLSDLQQNWESNSIVAGFALLSMSLT